MRQKIMEIIEEQPGLRKDALLSKLEISSYKLNRALKLISQDLVGRRLVHKGKHGVWIVDLSPELCSGLTWRGKANGGYAQCSCAPRFPDGRCYHHSQWENLDLVAFCRKLAYLTGPRDPNAHIVSQLSLTAIDELVAQLERVVPRTRSHREEKKKLGGIIAAGRAHALWKDMMRRRRQDDWIPPEYRQRHTASSINPFEYSLKKNFATLGVAADASKDEVLKAWRSLARKYHPDTRGGSEEKMKEVNLAKERIFRIRRWDRSKARK
jgi:DnaJ domain